ncbi:hypothetical protein ACHAWU_003055 [Discostella pseudostelligera]|uniref:SAYSvFN domain-containing protein n=1 Tax=Discostella pseudostelligera TaxID=259834 RepID=A0ABD3M8J6_9STRA
MPPPAPAFLPSNRRSQRLDPTRHLQSRELWNQVRFHASASRYASGSDYSHINGNGSNGKSSSSWNSNSNIQWAISLLRAILYEIQPFRIKPTLFQFQLFIQDGGWKSCASSFHSQLKSVVSIVLQTINALHQYLRNIDIHSIQSFVTTHKILLAKSSLALIALRIYYHTLIYLHDLLSAGPLIIILTLFTLLYTIGLGDNTGAGSGIPSAYSVFNRGVRRILGTVDGEELARQFAGGMAAVRVAAAGGGGGRGRGGMNNRDDDEIGGVWMMHHDENERNHHRRVVQEEEEPINVVNERRRQRRLERLQQQQRMGGEEGTAFLQRQEVNDVDGEDDIDDGDENFNHGGGGGGDAAPARTGAGVARKSGKKARRKNNVEMRREIQRQRQAAAAMGFGHGMENDDGGGAAALLLEEMDFDDMRDFDE